MFMNEQLLEEIGLTKGEIKVYLTLLKLGETTTGKIIEEAQISSGKIYEILEKLIKKGLASFIIREKTKYFSPASPNRIVDYIREKEKELNQKEQELLKELPSLLENIAFFLGIIFVLEIICRVIYTLSELARGKEGLGDEDEEK